MIPRQRRGARRFIMPAIILIVGGVIAWWAAHQQTQQLDEVQRFTRSICMLAADGEDVADKLNTDDFTAAQVTQLLHDVLLLPDRQTVAYSVNVAPGNQASYESKSLADVTHTATIAVRDEPRLRLFIRYDAQTDRCSVSGYEMVIAE